MSHGLCKLIQWKIFNNIFLVNCFRDERANKADNLLQLANGKQKKSDEHERKFTHKKNLRLETSHNSFFIATDSLPVLTDARQAQKSFPRSNNLFSRCLLSVGSDKRQIVSDRSKVMKIMICWTCDLFGLTIFCTTLLRIVNFNVKTRNGNSASANFLSFFLRLLSRWF